MAVATKKKKKSQEVSPETLESFEKQSGPTIMVDPADIVADQDYRGRKLPPTELQVRALAASMVEKGQLQPILCRLAPSAKNPLEEKLNVVFGFTRLEAAKLIKKGFTSPDGKREIHKPDFKLAVRVVDVDPEKARLLNIVENAIRSEVSPIDQAYMHQELREKDGLKDAQIARLYGYAQQTQVTQLKKLLNLEEEFIPLVHDGVISQTAAIELMKLSYEDRKEVIANLLETMQNLGKKKVTNPEVNKEIKDKVSKNGDGEESEGEDIVRPKTVKEIRNFFEDMSNSTDKVEAKFADAMIKFIKNDLSDDNFSKQLKKFISPK